MADELDLQTQQTLRDSGADQRPNMQPVADPEAGDALDSLLKAKTEKADDGNNNTDGSGAGGAGADGAKPNPEGAAAKEEPAADDAKGGGSDGTPASGQPASGSDSLQADSGGGRKVGDPVEGQAAPEDPFKEIQLPPHTSPKAADSFNAIKVKAKAEIEARDKELADARLKLKELESKTKVSASAEEKAELEALRKFRASAEIENDPEFKKAFQDRLVENDEAIYGKLTEAGMTKDQIDKIRKMGGPLKLANWDDVYSHLSPSQKRVVDAKLNDSENLVRERDVKIKSAKENVDKYLQERDKNSRLSVEAESKIIETTANELLGQLPWVAEQTIDAATPADKKALLEADNAFAKEQVDKLKSLLTDRSADTHAMLAIGTIQAFKFKRDLDSASKEIEQLRASNKELTEKLDKVKRSSGSTRRSNAPVSSSVKPVTDIFGTHGGNALDALRDQKLAEAN